MNLLDVGASIFDKGSKIADVYRDSHFQYKTLIRPFKIEMVEANNIILFIDNDNNIEGGQIGLFDPINGLRVELF